MTILDANFVLRYLLQDDEAMFVEASKVIENDMCLLLGEVLAEVVYVLGGYYEVPRNEIARALTLLLSQPNLQTTHNRKHLIGALEIFASSSLDYVDALLCAMGDDSEVATFDKKLQKCLQKRQTPDSFSR